MTDAELKALYDHFMHVVMDSDPYNQLLEDQCIYGRYFTETFQDETGAIKIRRVDPREVYPAEMLAPYP